MRRRRPLPLALLFASIAAVRAQAAPDFVVTTPVFFFQVAGFPGDLPTLTLDAGRTYEFQIQTSAIHPFFFSTLPESPGAFTEGVIGTMPTSNGTLLFTPPARAADYTLYYTCDVHFFSGAIQVRVGAAADADGDGVPDATDDCPFVADPGQADRGGIGAGSAPDGIGDACQCGDVNGDGRVTIADAAAIARSLLAPPTAVLAQPELCDVGGAPSPTNEVCTIGDAVIIRRALLQPPSATIAQVCAPAQP